MAQDDLISRQAVIDTANRLARDNFTIRNEYQYYLGALHDISDEVKKLPSTHPERDTPIKPKETTDRAWGIPSRQAVCPKCDYYLGHVAFLGDYKGKRVTYCETCGQAIGWEGWDFETDYDGFCSYAERRTDEQTV